MKLEEIRSIARSKNIKLGRVSKTVMIKSIQASEGNFDCFASATGGECDQAGCSWREDCLEISRSGNL